MSVIAPQQSSNLQKEIHQSLCVYVNFHTHSVVRAPLDLPSTHLPVSVGRGGDMEMELALALSRQQLEEDDRRRREEEEELEMVLRLSLEDK